MTSTDSPASIEERIQKEIASINKKIEELTKEKHVLERLLLKARQENVAARDVTRKNSVGRILVEKAVIEALTKALKPMASRELLEHARLTDHSLKDVTFRSYLHRMKLRQIIENPPGQPGRWQLVKTRDSAPRPMATR